MSDLGIVDNADASYLDIDDILMTDNKIICRARYDLVDLEVMITNLNSNPTGHINCSATLTLI